MQVQKIFRTAEVSKKGRKYSRRHGVYYCEVWRDTNDDIRASEVLFDWDGAYLGKGIAPMDGDSYAVTHGGRLFQKMQWGFPDQEEMIDIFFGLEEKEKSRE